MKRETDNIALRARAEATLEAGVSAVDATALSDVAAVLHELNVHSIELEMQNANLLEIEQALTRSRERYLELFRSAPVGYFVLDNRGVVLEVNPEGLGHLGKEADAVLGTPMLPHLAVESHAAFASLLAEVWRGHERASAEVEVPGSGERRSLLARAVMSTGGPGGQPVLLCATIDISARKRAERELSRSEVRYRSLFEGSRDALLLLTRAGTILEVNDAAAALFGLSKPDLRRRWLADLFTDAAAETIARLVADGGSAPQRAEEVTAKRADGQSLSVELSISPIDGGMALLSARDMRERLRLAQLLGRKERLDALERLAGGIAHDMNNVLAVVLSVGGTLRDALPPGQARDDLQTILTAARRGGQFTGSLLAFARGDTVVHQPIDLSSLCNDVLLLIGRTLPPEIRVVSSLTADGPIVEGDGAALGHALLDLCTNAVEAMPDGGELRVETAVVEGGAKVRLSVRDTGRGMSEEEVAHAFEPFFTTKEDGRRAGVGLSTAYGTAKAHRGTIHLDSAPGKGTTVILELPRHEPRPTSPAHPERPAPSNARPRVLVVDDEPAVLRGVVRILQRMPVDVSAEADAEKVLDLCAEHGPFDLYVFDVNMPRLDGLTLGRRLRERQPGARFIFMSGYNAEQIDAVFRNDEGASFLNKPFELRTLQDLVAEMLER